MMSIFVGLFIVLMLCRGITAPVSSVAPLEPAQAQSVIICPVTPMETGDHTLMIFSDGIDRTVELYIPESLDQTSPAPLVVGLHGLGQTAEAYLNLTGWRDLADEYGFILAAPNGLNMMWNTGLFEHLMHRAVVADDVLFFQDMLTEIEAQLCIDPSRIYLSGFSNGGGMAERLACDVADQVSAVGMVAGAVNADFSQCEPTRPVPLVSFNGTDDTVVPYAGNPNLAIAEVSPWLDQWAERAACDPEPVTERITDDVQQLRYENCAVPVVHYIIEGGRHGWPGGTPTVESAATLTTDTISATELTWLFFESLHNADE